MMYLFATYMLLVRYTYSLLIVLICYLFATYLLLNHYLFNGGKAGGFQSRKSGGFPNKTPPAFSPLNK